MSSPSREEVATLHYLTKKTVLRISLLGDEYEQYERARTGVRVKGNKCRAALRLVERAQVPVQGQKKTLEGRFPRGVHCGSQAATQQTCSAPDVENIERRQEGPRHHWLDMRARDMARLEARAAQVAWKERLR
ncbi:hypothetical protein JCM8547_005363 [Rhodosporidiobolus lusitaniae]